MKTKNGFTIIELIVVIAIIAVLASVVTSAVVKYVASSKIARANEDANNIQKALIMFYGEYGDYPYLPISNCPAPYCSAEYSNGSDSYLTINTVNHFISEFYKIPSADYFVTGGYYYVNLFDNDGDGKIGCGGVYLVDGSSTYGNKPILCQDCDCSSIGEPFQINPIIY
jgi:prepilin-type N-terminal cleavage/methylation domain-containing protein